MLKVTVTAATTLLASLALFAQTQTRCLQVGRLAQRLTSRKILQHLSAKRDWCCSEAELEVCTRNLLGETFGAFVNRASALHLV